MEIAIISGKGGTGKSSISAALATLAERAVVADCDVDAANLYLIFNPTIEEEYIYIAGQKAVIDESQCTNCGFCMRHCRFGAITKTDGSIRINETLCDGCKLCSRVCPYDAISMVENNKSRMYAGQFRNGEMVYGRLAPGEENSGKLVNMVREEARQIAKEKSLETIIIDGPPGIGCAVISTITGVDHVVIVTEPTLSGLHDLERTVEMVSKFNLKVWILVNKFDLNEEISNRIETYCNEKRLAFAGKIPFDKQVVEAMVQCKSIVEYAPESRISALLTDIYTKIRNRN
jgi:MinD superfamily P-loop ATPase